MIIAQHLKIAELSSMYLKCGAFHYGSTAGDRNLESSAICLNYFTSKTHLESFAGTSSIAMPAKISDFTSYMRNVIIIYVH